MHELETIRGIAFRKKTGDLGLLSKQSRSSTLQDTVIARTSIDPEQKAIALAWLQLVGDVTSRYNKLRCSHGNTRAEIAEAMREEFARHPTVRRWTYTGYGWPDYVKQQRAHIKIYGDRASEQVPKGRFHRTRGYGTRGMGEGELSDCN